MTFPTAWDLSEDEENTETTLDKGAVIAAKIEGIEYDTVQDNMQVTPQDTMQDTMQVSMQVEQIVVALHESLSRDEFQGKVKIQNRDYFRKAYINEGLKHELIEMTIPDKPNSRFQKYRLTEKGKALQIQLKK